MGHRTKKINPSKHGFFDPQDDFMPLNPKPLNIYVKIEQKVSKFFCPIKLFLDHGLTTLDPPSNFFY
jgi:hypothetical protein